MSISYGQKSLALDHDQCIVDFIILLPLSLNPALTMLPICWTPFSLANCILKSCLVVLVTQLMEELH